MGSLGCLRGGPTTAAVDFPRDRKLGRFADRLHIVRSQNNGQRRSHYKGISEIRFWHVASGRDDFNTGGWRFNQVTRSLKSERKSNSKRPSAYDAPQWLYNEFLWIPPKSEARCEIMCAIVQGFFCLIRIVEIEQCARGAVTIGRGRDGGNIATLVPTRSKTNQFNDGDVEILKTVRNSMRPVNMVGRWLFTPRTSNRGDGSQFRPHLRTRVTSALRLEGAACGLEGSRFRSHSLRIGGGAISDVRRRLRRRDNQTLGTLPHQSFPTVYLARPLRDVYYRKGYRRCHTTGRFAHGPCMRR